MPWTFALSLSLAALAVPEDGAAKKPCCLDEEVVLAPLPEGAPRALVRLREIAGAARASRHPYLGSGMLDELDANWRAAKEARDDAALFGAHYALGLYQVRLGRIDDAIEDLEAAVALTDSLGDAAPALRAEALYALGMAGFRLAEKQNCVADHNADSCIFPLAGGAVHRQRRGAEVALATFQELLAKGAGERLPEARWLVNVAHMALGDWPDAVPGADRLPSARLDSEAPFPRFADVAPEWGLARRSRAGSIVADDFDGDGRIDVLSSSFDPEKPLRMSRNLGGGAFQDVTGASGLLDQLGGSNLVQADADGNGRIDVLVLRGAGLGGEGAWPVSLLLQGEGGVFRERAAESGLGLEAPSGTAAFADFDVDGDLDLFVGCDTEAPRDGGPARFPSRLFQNAGAASYADATAASGIGPRAPCAAAVAGDFDADGLPDLFLSLRGADCALFRNEGELRFRDVAAEAGVAAPRDGSAAFAFDPDNDGDLDLYCAYFSHVAAERAVARWFLEDAVECDTGHLYRNDGRGRFDDVTAERGLRRVAIATGAARGDVDGDGYDDVYLATGGTELSSLFPNVMLWNDGGRRFRDVTRAGGFGHLQKGNGIAFADLDRDGDSEVVLQVGGFFPDDLFGDVVFRNPGFGNRWIDVRLVGRGANTFGVGARIRVRVVEGERERDVFCWVWPASSLGGSPLVQRIGLGKAERIAEVAVDWPGGGEPTLLESAALDTAIEVRQPAR